MAKDLSISSCSIFYSHASPISSGKSPNFITDDDLSLAEIADHCHITRQGVRDSIKPAAG